jgi:hypothetical protein
VPALEARRAKAMNDLAEERLGADGVPPVAGGTGDRAAGAEPLDEPRVEVDGPGPIGQRRPGPRESDLEPILAVLQPLERIEPERVTPGAEAGRRVGAEDRGRRGRDALTVLQDLDLHRDVRLVPIRRPAMEAEQVEPVDAPFELHGERAQSGSGADVQRNFCW